ncbi:MAG: 2-methylfumaryl-CoA isomerase [Proteobacteria bacterium]|nr:2-methylfumaryl-CoA isomerase [Pseudomonadota bacterium]
MQPILKGLRIIEGSAFIAAPMCGMTLAQLGADVIRFDHIGGGMDYHRWPVTKDNNSIYWAEMNKGKRSIAVDLKSDEGRELISELICSEGDDAGIFSTNLPARGWLSYNELSKRRSDLIQHEIVGDRHGGTALDYTVNAKVGFPYITGPLDDERPVNHVLPAWDITTAYLAAIDILAAERHRRLTGEGQQVKLALADVALTTMGHLGYIGEVHINNETRQRNGNYLFGALGRDFVTADKERVMVIAINEKQWRGLLEATGLVEEVSQIEGLMRLDFSTEGDRFKAREELCRLLEPWFARQTLQTVEKVFTNCGICWDKYQTVTELVTNDPDCSPANPVFEEIEQPGIGRYPVSSGAMHFSKIQRSSPRPAPILGNHTDEILADILKLDSSTIGKLHDNRIVA